MYGIGLKNNGEQAQIETPSWWNYLTCKRVKKIVLGTECMSGFSSFFEKESPKTFQQVYPYEFLIHRPILHEMADSMTSYHNDDDDYIIHSNLEWLQSLATKFRNRLSLTLFHTYLTKGVNIMKQNTWLWSPTPETFAFCRRVRDPLDDADCTLLILKKCIQFHDGLIKSL